MERNPAFVAAIEQGRADYKAGRFTRYYRETDAGLVRERADALIASALDDPSDPFALVHLEGDELSSDPARLTEEALTIPLLELLEMTLLLMVSVPPELSMPW